MIAAIPGTANLWLTIDGVPQRGLCAAALAKSAPDRANLSLDALCAGRFEQITRRGQNHDMTSGLAS